MLDTLANAQLYRAAGFTDAQVDALVERDRMIEAAREASSQPSRSQRVVYAKPLDTKAQLQTILANHWRLSLILGVIVAEGFWPAMSFLALKH